MESRFERNIPTISEPEQNTLRGCTAAIIGAGGLGGYAVEFLTRLGIGALILCDGDSFSESNLNRQLLAHSGNLGQNKAEAAALRAKLIHPDLAVRVYPCFLTAENAQEILKNADIVIDGLDTVSGRLLLEDICTERRLPLVHGAIHGWDYQAALVDPESKFLHGIYQTGTENFSSGNSAPEGATAAAFPSDDAPAPETQISVLPMTAAFCACLQCSLTLKKLLGRPVQKNTLYYGSVADPSLDSFRSDILSVP